jgi:hypothetical protein
MWKPIGTEQYEEALELAAIVDGEVVWSLQPCRRVVGGWVHCETHDPVRPRPTHWRPANEDCRCFARRQTKARADVQARAAAAQAGGGSGLPGDPA